MLKIGRVRSRNCQGVTRRELLEVGGLGLLGLTLADQLQAEELSKAQPQTAKQPAQTSCIFIFLEESPSHFGKSVTGQDLPAADFRKELTAKPE